MQRFFSHIQIPNFKGEFFLFFFLILFGNDLFGQKDQEQSKERKTREGQNEKNFIQKFLEEDTSRQVKNANGFVGFPILYYSPETKFGFGTAGMYHFRFDKENSVTQSSNIQLAAIYTLNNQVLLQSPFELFIDNGNFYIFGELAYYKFPYQFYGTGNDVQLDEFEKYNARFARFRITGLKKFHPGFYAGIRWWADNYFSIDKGKGGKLNENITGSTPGISSGIGLTSLYDSRDNTLSATKGWYIENSLTFYRSFTLSDYEFTNYIIDARKYFSLKGNQTIALNSYWHFSSGNVPFHQLALFGGDKRMRGYYEGGYRAKNMGIFQVEYRNYPFKSFLLDRIGFALFGGVGSVYNDYRNFNKSFIRPEFGAGLRFLFDKQQKIVVRLDYGRGINTDGIYVTVNEAF